jgi:hypothetical protein
MKLTSRQRRELERLQMLIDAGKANNLPYVEFESTVTTTERVRLPLTPPTPPPGDDPTDADTFMAARQSRAKRSTLK